MPGAILIVEDDALQQEMLESLLQRKLGYTTRSAANGREALEILENNTGKPVRLVIMDLNMPVMGGMETLEILRQRYPFMPVIMLTGSKDIDDVVKAMKIGATDFITKPFDTARMMVTVKNAMKIALLSREISRLQSEKERRFTFENLIGHESGLLSVTNAGRKAAAVDIPVLITGETGTGKEVLALAIHGESARAGKPFIAVNCGAIPSQLVESVLFGHEKGSFTGATEKTIGKFREAEGGTIFLDEIGELPLDAQVKLLRVIQQKEVEPVGASKPVPINIRVMSATNRNLEEEIKKRNFREDLFFRLNVLQITMPTLRERKNDIPALSTYFIERFCAREGITPKEISAAAEKSLLQNEWPGNVRQLENAINRAMAMSENETLEPADFSASLTDIENTQPHQKSAITKTAITLFTATGTFKTAQKIEQDAMHAALQYSNGNITEAARMLGMAKSTFYKKMKSL